jgi:hypothetical protein
MTSKKEEPSKPKTTEQQPKTPKSGELDEKQLDKAVGGIGGGHVGPSGPGG